MADSKILQPFILSWEGGFANDPNDKGGATMKGVTIGTFRQIFGASKTVNDLKNITDEQWHTVYKRFYWDVWKADQIYSQSIANLLVDYAWASGPVLSVKKIQGLLGVTADGIVGPKTLGAINSKDRLKLFTDIWQFRKRFIETRADFKHFGKGWLNRLNGIGFGYLVLNKVGSPRITFHDER